jgi:hypothetical protein
MPNTHAVPMPSPPAQDAEHPCGADALAANPCDLGDRSLPGLRRPTPTSGIHPSGCNCLLTAITAVLASVFTFAKVKL